MLELSKLVELFGIELDEGCQFIEAATLADRYDPGVNVSWPLIVTNVHDTVMPLNVKKTLQNAYPYDYAVAVVDDGDQSNGKVTNTLWHRLDAYDYRHGACIYLPPRIPGSDFTDLMQTIAHLRSPVGCPWDREQTMASLRHDLLSETVEVMEAIDLDTDLRDNADHIAEELGDVLLLVTMIAQIATDEGRFQMADVMHGIVAKLIRRHPHVFGDVSVKDSDDVAAHWDAIKRQEKAEKGQVVDSPLDGIPVYLPALEKAREVQSKASKAGLLDRSELAASLPDLTALVGEDPSEESIGELLWALTALVREHGIVAEDALRQHAVNYRRSVEDGLADTVE